MSITPHGNIFPCNHTNFDENTLNIGNIHSGLNEEKIQWLKEQIRTADSECEECSLKGRCNYCYINMYEETKNLWQIPDWYCAMNQIVIINSDILAAKLYEENNKYFLHKFYNKPLC